MQCCGRKVLSKCVGKTERRINMTISWKRLRAAFGRQLLGLGSFTGALSFEAIQLTKVIRSVVRPNTAMLCCHQCGEA